jgi:hypothetical protein
MRRIVPAAAVAFAIVSTGVAVAVAASMPAPQQPLPPAGLVPQTYATTTTTTVVVGRGTVSPAPSSGRPGAVQHNVVPAAPAETTAAGPLPMACGYPRVAPEPPATSGSSVPQRTPAPTPTVTAVIPPDTCPLYVAYP